MDEYEKLLANSKRDWENATDTNKLQKSMRRSISSSRWKLILATLTTGLLIVPISYLLTFIYYAFGTSSTTLMDVASNTLYVTEPNTSLEEMEFDMEFTPFSMKLGFDQYKRIGEEDYIANTYNLQFTLGSLSKKEVDTSLERVGAKHPTETNPWLTHPDNRNEIDNSREWKVLEGLPNETVAEAYISLNDVVDVEEIEKLMPNVDIVWAAIDTGVEDKNLSKDGDVVSPIGYPIQLDQTYWSPFRDVASNEEAFIDILQFIVKHEELATEVSSAKNLALSERIEYIEKNGVKTYAVVVTGPKQELLGLKDLSVIRTLKIGEVKLWNWSH